LTARRNVAVRQSQQKYGEGKGHMEDQTLLTMQEAAVLLRIKLSTIRAWKLHGKFLAFRKIGGRVLVHKDDIQRFISQSKIPAKAVVR
jgi:excisionase family DNA binding protein